MPFISSQQSSQYPKPHSTSVAYGAGDLSIYDGGIYKANDYVPMGTAFSTGTSGATWRHLSDSLLAADTSWTTVGGISVTASPTPPTVAASPVINQVRVRQVGNKEWEYQLRYAAGVGGTAGSGWYAYNLPSGHQFDPAHHSFYTGVDQIDNTTLLRSSLDTVYGVMSNGGNHARAFAVSVNSTQFRIYVINRTYTKLFQASTWFNYSAGNTTIRLLFKYFRL